MGKFLVTGPDGTKYEVNAPDGATEQEAIAYVQKNMAAPAIPGDKPLDFDPTDRRSGFFRGAKDIQQGVVQLVGKALRPLTDEGSGMRQMIDEIDQTGAADRKIYDTERKSAGEAGDTDWGRMGGNVAAGLPLSLAVPGAGAVTIPGKIAYGAASGAMGGAAMPVDQGDYWSEKGQQAAIGAGTGAGTAGVFAGAGRMLKPNTNPAVRALMDEGVTPTPGQALGGLWKSGEEAIGSIPLIGGFVKSGQRRATEQFNTATLNKALAPINETVTGVTPGREAVAKAGQIVSDAYDDTLSRMTGAVDQTFAQDMTTVAQKALSELPPEKATQFQKMMGNVFQKAGPGQTIDGDTAKGIVSQLRQKAADYRSSTDPDQRALGNLFDEAGVAFKDLMRRGNPNHAVKLDDIDQAYAMLQRAEVAAGRVGSKEGIFSPAALTSAVRETDKSLRKKSFARGDALLQKFAEGSEKVLGPTVPDSGTAIRGLTGATALGLIDPTYMLGALGSGAVYSSPGQKLAAALIAGKRPQAVQKTGQALQNVSPYAAALASYLNGPNP